MQRCQKQRNVHNPLPECEWNFTSSRVPDAELVACCLWEYARESVTLKELRQRCVKACCTDGIADSLIPIVAGTIRHPINSVEVFLREIVLQCPPDLWQSKDPSKRFYTPPGFPPPLTSSFPASWQSLSSNERTWRTEHTDLKAKPYFPFRRGRLRDARYIVGTVLSQRLHALKPSAHPLERREIIGIPMVPLDRVDYWAGSEDGLPGGFLFPDGAELSVVEIDWSHCTDKEIAEWVKAARPPSIPEPKDKGGHKRGDWRAMLVRIGLLRLRHHYTTEETLAIIADCLTTTQRKKVKFVEPGECNREANAAVKDFRELFPFLAPAEMPCSWPLK
jgi:hypothetical protein